MPRCYMVKKGQRGNEGPPPCSPTEASVAPPCYSPAEPSAVTEADTRSVEYAELGSSNAVVGERSAADTEAAHELLSLAQSVPPLPPAALVTVIAEPPPQIYAPIYTYTIQPTNIYILADEPPQPVYTTVQTLPPIQTIPPIQTVPIEYIDQPPINYVTYQSAVDAPPDYAEYGDVTEYTVQAVPEPEPELEIETDVEPEVDPDVQIGFLQELPAPPPPTPPSAPSPKRVRKPAKYDCNECGKRYATSSNLSRHKQTHRSLDSQSAKRCGECGKAYVSMPALAMHVLTHRMGHVCGVCGKQFSRPWLLRGHLRSHTGEKPYNCAECGKAFADRSNLRAHLQTHSLDKKYECERCRKVFALKSYLNKHQEAACGRAEDEDE